MELDPTAPDHDALEFKYPVGVSDSLIPKTIRPSIRLELGCRGDQWPSENGKVTPYSAEAFPEQFAVRNASVTVLSAERTFWEKATILHREYYRFEAGKSVSERLFRHYDDIVVMSKHERAKLALRNFELLEQVADHKQHFFREATARYDLARKGTIHLAPSPNLMRELKKDYEKTREMYFGKEPDFDAVMREILELENTINQS